jgi:isohexenylglutaconyl-CoA hydratase
MPEATLGLVPAAISPFVIQRIGLTAARRLGVTGARLTAAEAAGLGITHRVVADGAALESAILETANLVLECAPEAVAETKLLMLRAATATPWPQLLDLAAKKFAASVRSAEGREGTAAFVEKRKPAWAAKVT